MAEVRKYFCCTDNLTGCKIIGGVQFVLNATWLIISIIELSQIPAYAHSIGLGIWAELIAIGAREEVKSYQSIGVQRYAERRSGAALQDPEPQTDRQT